MSKEDDIRDILREMHGDIRAIGARQEEHKGYIDAVNGKASKIREELDGHKADGSAHGAGAVKAAVGMGLSAGGLLMALWKAIH